MAWNNKGRKAMGPILYQSEPQATTQQNVMQAFNFAMGGINLLAGQQYMVFLNVSKFPSSGAGSMGARPLSNSYSGGEFFVGRDFDLLTTNSSWNSKDGRSDLAFKASFSAPTPIPTPALLPGLIGMSVALLRQRKAAAAEEASEG